MEPCFRNSRWSVTRQPRHAVEVIVSAGKMHKAVVAHDGYHERVAAEQFGLLADSGGPGNVVQVDRQDLDAEARDFIDRQAKLAEQGDIRVVLLEALGDPFMGQPKRITASMVMTRWATSLTTSAVVKPRISWRAIRSSNC